MIDILALQANLGYIFTDHIHVERALTHASKYAQSEGRDYERLEFLGDRVVNLVIADLLFRLFPEEKEGALAKRHTALVRGETLAAAARAMKLGDFAMLSDAERNAGGAENDNILGDMMEAVTAAIYLDGGYNAAVTFIERALGDDLHNMIEPPRDPKTALQEWSQSHGLGLPIYTLIGQSGPDHAPVFEIQVSIHGHAPMMASSTSKKRAERDAASALLLTIEDKK